MSEKNPFAPDFNDLPEILPVFPLRGALLLPSGRLPLNIFEPRYLAMVERAMATNRLIGMVQPRDDGDPPALYETGCAGKIIEFSETPDGRYLITLAGIARFRISKELGQDNGYRRVSAIWNGFEEDLTQSGCLGLDRKALNGLLGQYFEMQGMSCDWDAVETATDGRLITCLSMVCPFDPAEKQALLEADCCKTRAGMFMTMLEMALKSGEVDTGALCSKNKH